MKVHSKGKRCKYRCDRCGILTIETYDKQLDNLPPGWGRFGLKHHYCAGCIAIVRPKDKENEQIHAAEAEKEVREGRARTNQEGIRAARARMGHRS